MRHFVIKAVANSAAKIGQTDAILHPESNLEKWRQAFVPPFLGMMAFINEGVTVESLFIENLYWCEYSLSISQTSLFSIEGFKFFLTHKK